MLEVTKKSDKDIAQECIIPHLMRVCLEGINKEGVNSIPKERINLVIQDSFQPLKSLSPKRREVVGSIVSKEVCKIMNASTVVASYKELTLAACFMYLELIRTGRWEDVSSQTATLICCIVEESLDYGDWGSIKSAKRDSINMLRTLQLDGFFTKDLRNGSSVIH